MPQVKSFDCADVGIVDLRTSGFGVDGMPETRLIVYLRRPRSTPRRSRGCASSRGGGASARYQPSARRAPHHCGSPSAGREIRATRGCGLSAATVDVMERHTPGGCPSPLLSARVLGRFSVMLDGHPVDTLSSRRTRNVLAYLLTHRRVPVPRDVLMDAFWPHADPEAARNSLHVALTGVRHALRCAWPGPVLQRVHDTYLLADTSPCGSTSKSSSSTAATGSAPSTRGPDRGDPVLRSRGAVLRRRLPADTRMRTRRRPPARRCATRPSRRSHAWSSCT